MKNLVITNEVVIGNVYIVEMEDGDTNSYRIISETATHFIFSFSKDDSVEVFEKAKGEVRGIYSVNDWWKSVKA